MVLFIALSEVEDKIDPGWVKLLDFGLAKLMEPSSSEFSQTKTLRTEENSSSERGTLVGTVAYMSPGQTLGEELKVN